MKLPFVPRSTYDLAIQQAKDAQARAAAADERARLSAAEARLAIRDGLEAVRQAVQVCKMVATQSTPAEMDDELPAPTSVRQHDSKRVQDLKDREARR